MKKLFAILVTIVPIAIGVGIILTASVFAQAPQEMSYQAVIRNSSQELVANQSIGMQISILQNSESGSAVYVETQTPTTNVNGLVNLEIGAGTVQSGDFATINWAEGSYFVKTETDLTGGTNYTITGTSQLLSVPFALHANEVDPSVPQGTQAGEIQYWNGTKWVIVAAGSEGEVLAFVSGVPTWKILLSEGEVENPTTGRIWMDRNLGASRVATSGTDADAYGDLYQWGRLADGHEKRTSSITTTLSGSDIPGHGKFIVNPRFPNDWRNPQNVDLWQGVNGTNNPCPSGFRLPTIVEWEVEKQSWSVDDNFGAFSSPLRLTQAGFRYWDSQGTIYGVGFTGTGSYWSSTADGPVSLAQGFNYTGTPLHGNHRAYGCSVRCIKD